MAPSEKVRRPSAELPKFVNQECSPEEWRAAAESLTQRVLKTDALSAWERVCAGEYEGTPFAAELSQLMFLAGVAEFHQ